MNRQKFITKIQRSFDNATQTAIANMQSQLTEERRPYPNETIRRVGSGTTGKIAGSPRDVVDTGELVNSLNVDVKISPELIAVMAIWLAEHGIYVLRDQKSPYNWVIKGLRRTDLAHEFRKELSK